MIGVEPISIVPKTIMLTITPHLYIILVAVGFEPTYIKTKI